MAPMSPTNGLNRRGIAQTNGLNPEVWPPPGVESKEVHARSVTVIRIRVIAVE